MKDAFWAGGRQAYEAGLRELSALIEDLRQRLGECTDADERKQLELQLSDAKASHDATPKSTSRFLF